VFRVLCVVFHDYLPPSQSPAPPNTSASLPGQRIVLLPTLPRLNTQLRLHIFEWAGRHSFASCPVDHPKHRWGMSSRVMWKMELYLFGYHPSSSPLLPSTTSLLLLPFITDDHTYPLSLPDDMASRALCTAIRPAPILEQTPCLLRDDSSPNYMILLFDRSLLHAGSII